MNLLERVLQRASKMVKRQDNMSWKLRLRELLLFSMEREVLRAGFLKCTAVWEEAEKKMELDSIQYVYWQEKRRWAQTEAQEIPSEMLREIFCYESDRALVQVVHWGCVGSFLRNLQKKIQILHPIQIEIVYIMLLWAAELTGIRKYIYWEFSITVT